MNLRWPRARAPALPRRGSGARGESRGGQRRLLRRRRDRAFSQPTTLRGCETGTSSGRARTRVAMPTHRYPAIRARNVAANARACTRLPAQNLHGKEGVGVRVRQRAFLICRDAKARAELRRAELVPLDPAIHSLATEAPPARVHLPGDTIRRSSHQGRTRFRTRPSDRLLCGDRSAPSSSLNTCP